MEKDLAQYGPPLLLVAGFAFQWLRQFNKVTDHWTYLYAVALAGGVYALTHTFAPGSVRLEIITGILWLSGNVGTVLGGTFIASSAAKAGVAVVPMTNSK